MVDIEYGVAEAANFGLRFAEEGLITTSWNGEATSTGVLFSLVIRASADAQLSDVINVSSRYTAAEAYGHGETMNVGINFSNGVQSASADQFALFQNIPNPFADKTMISFNLPTDNEVMITLSDVKGRVLHTIKGDYTAGFNNVNITKTMLQGITGVVNYTVTAGEYTATRKMVIIE